MLAIIRGYDWREFYLPKMPGLACAFYILLSLLKKYMPEVQKHILSVHFEPSVFASQWFMTLYSLILPFECILRIWDIFFIEGKKIIYRVALAIFKLN